MKINLNFGYDKLHLKEIIILIPKYHSNMVSFLTPILGLYGINVKDFINEFESKTKFITFDVVIPTSVKISKIKTFEITLKTPYIVPLLSNLEGFSLSKPNVNILSVYKISLLKSIVSYNFVANYHRDIYISLRKYISLVTKGTHSIKVSSPSLSFNLYSLGENKVKFLKNSLSKFLHFRELFNSRFGTFVVFNNVSANITNTLKKYLSIYNISLTKISSKFLSTLCGKIYFQGVVYLISSVYFNCFFNFYREVYLKTFHSNFFPVYWKFGSNLTTRLFFKEICNGFTKNLNFSLLYILKLLKINILKILKIVNYCNKNLIFITKYCYANLSSNIT